MAKKQELSALESRDIMHESKGYQEGVERERRRVINHLLYMNECGDTELNINKLVKWIEDGSKGTE